MNWDEDEDETTHIFGGNDPALDASWQVNLSDTETRTMTAVEIGVEFGRGKLDQNDTFVWREGMRDWVPLGKCGDLLPILNQYSGQASAPAAPPAPPARPVQPSMPFATPAALSAGQSPLRGPMPSNPAMQTGAFAHAATQANPAQAQPSAASQTPEKKSSMGLIIGLTIGGLVLVGGGAAAFFMLRSTGGSAAATPSATAAVAATVAPTASTTAEAATPPSEPPSPTPEASASTAASAATAAEAPAADAKKGAKADAVASTSDKDTKKDSKDPKDVKKEDPKDTKKEAKGGGGEFNVDAARSALASAAAAASGCGKPSGPTGRGRATVTFAPSGSVSSAQVDPPFAGTPVGSCAVAAFKGARVPPFSGSSQTVTKSFNVK
jgi:hypothetical protein